MFYNYDRWVRVHHYDREEFYYKGSEEHMQIKGCGLPFSTTDISPQSEQCEDGWIYVFDGDAWVKKEDIYKKPNISELNYLYSNPLPPYFTKAHIENPINFMPSYRGIKKFSNPNNQAILIATKFSVIQDDFLDLIAFHKKVIYEVKNPSMKPYYENIFVKFRLKTEGLILSIRTLLDELTQLTYILTYTNEFESTLRIKVDSIGVLFNEKKMMRYSICRDIILGNDSKYIKDTTSFISTINDLFNSIKHSHLHHESLRSYADVPNVVSLYVKMNDFSNYEIEYHNHNLFHIMHGFIDNFQRIIGNQKIFCSQ